jgi:hypothetical protein
MDISKCLDNTCPLKDKCWRFTAPANPLWQSYGNFQYEIKEDGEVKCDYFWDNEEYGKNNRLQNKT